MDDVYDIDELYAIVESVAELIDTQLRLTGEEHRNIRANLGKVSRFIQSHESMPVGPVKGKRDA